MAWIKTQKGQLISVATVVIDEIVAPHEVRGDASFARFTLGEYKDPETAKAVLGMIERWIAGEPDPKMENYGRNLNGLGIVNDWSIGFIHDDKRLFVMPGKDFMKQFEPLIDCQREADLVAEQAFKCCGGGFKSYMAAGIDVDKATESILKSCRSIGPVVTTLPIPDSVMHFDFLSHHGKNVVGVSFDRATNIVSVEFGDPSGDQIEKTCRNCGAAGIYCIGCKQGLTNWTPKGGK